METRLEDVNRWGRRVEVAAAAIFLVVNAVISVWPFVPFARPWLAVALLIMFAGLVNRLHVAAGLIGGLIVMIGCYVIGGIVAASSPFTFREAAIFAGWASVTAYFGISALAAWLITFEGGLASDYTPPEHSAEELLASQGRGRTT